MVIPPDELRVIRANEAKKAGRLAGIEVVCGGFDDLEMFTEDRLSRDKVVDVIRYANPDLIITHAPNDYMPDHTATQKLVFDACFTATLPNYTTITENKNKVNSPAKLVPVYYMDTLAGVNFNPTLFVDITNTIDLKIKMLSCHESQIVWMKEHDGIDFCDMVKTCSRYRGYQCGADYAIGGADGTLGRGMQWQGLSLWMTLRHSTMPWITSSYIPTLPGKLFFMKELAGPLEAECN